MMGSSIGIQLRAGGRKALPEEVTVAGGHYRCNKVLKHDFFAATALYQLRKTEQTPEKGLPRRIILKMARRGDFLGIPLRWLGRAICRHEIGNLRHLQSLDQVPRYLGRYEDTGFFYEYIEGCSLDERPVLPGDFFERLEELIRSIHSRRVAYIDMNKRGNILLGEDNLPYMIDFQIACHIPRGEGLGGRIMDGLFSLLTKEDIYHLRKHQRRLAGEQLEPEQLEAFQRKSPWIKTHRRLSRPLTRHRRRILGFLLRRGHLRVDEAERTNPESDPGRWDK